MRLQSYDLEAECEKQFIDGRGGGKDRQRKGRLGNETNLARCRDVKRGTDAGSLERKTRCDARSISGGNAHGGGKQMGPVHKTEGESR